MVEQRSKKKITFTDQLRIIFKEPLEAIGKYLADRNISANSITLLGVLGTMVGAVPCISRVSGWGGGVVILSVGILDALDGAVARAAQSPKKFGAFLDSVSDRYIEIFIYAGLLWYFMQTGNQLGVLFSYISVAGSVLVSYARARAESLGIETKVGVLTRVERMVVIGPAILLKIPLIGVIIVGVLANFTAFQRIFHVWQQTKELE